MAAGLVSTSARNLSRPSKVKRRLRTSSATNSPQPASAKVSNPKRTEERSSELKTSLSTAQPAPIKASSQRGRKPAASMMGNKYRMPKATNGLVHQSATAMIKTIAPLANRTDVLLRSSHTLSKRHMGFGFGAFIISSLFVSDRVIK